VSLQPYSDTGLLHFLWDILVTVVLHTGQWLTVVLFMICVNKNCFLSPLHDYDQLCYDFSMVFRFITSIHHTSLIMNVHLSPMFVHDSRIYQIIF